MRHTIVRTTVQHTPLEPAESEVVPSHSDAANGDSRSELDEFKSWLQDEEHELDALAAAAQGSVPASPANFGGFSRDR